MAWKAEENQDMVAMQANDIKWAQWIRVARNYQLRVGLKDRSRETFDGFVREVSKLRDIGVLMSYLILCITGPRQASPTPQAVLQHHTRNEGGLIQGMELGSNRFPRCATTNSKACPCLN